ncbi:hypothetical protein [Armatimonas sp.]|uniref:hypothetical protein n=1 Tax=Armatimonas sp. TaxID=1872638 RepID=UPI00374CE6BA
MDIYFRQGRSWTRRISGKSGGGEARFFEALPQRNLNLSLRKNDGRGRVSVRQHPSRSNDYTAIVRVVDHKAAVGSYEFTLRWND